MRYCITGAAGNISKLLSQKLLASGHQVRIIGRDENHLIPLKLLGAETAIGSVENQNFVCDSFDGVDAVYTMCPPALGNKNGLVEFCERVGSNYLKAIKQNKIKFVVNLSSIGAHLSKESGHILSMNRVEQQLNNLKNTAIRHLRPAFLYTNLYSQVEIIRNFGFMGGSFEFKTKKFPIVDPSDIATVAEKELTGLNFSGHSYIYAASQETNTDELAEAIGRAIGISGLIWVRFDDKQAFEGMKLAGFSDKTAVEFIEGFKAFEEGRITEDYWNNPPPLGKIKLDEFARRFASVYHQDDASLKTK